MAKRPNCNECGSNKITSRGSRWYCNSCEHSFTKYPKRIEIPNRPKKCPRCGYDKILSGGIRWICKGCLRSWLKINNPRRHDMGQRPPCPYCGSTDPHSKGPTRWQCTNPNCRHQWNKGGQVTYQMSDMLRAQTIKI